MNGQFQAPSPLPCGRVSPPPGNAVKDFSANRAMRGIQVEFGFRTRRGLFHRTTLSPPPGALSAQRGLGSHQFALVAKYCRPLWGLSRGHARGQIEHFLEASCRSATPKRTTLGRSRFFCLRRSRGVHSVPSAADLLSRFSCIHEGVRRPSGAGNYRLTSKGARRSRCRMQ
jgi:hypothetical protein